MIPEEIGHSSEYKSHPGLLKFKINLDHFKPNENFESFPAYIKVFVNDDDVQPYVKEENLMIWLKVKPHINNSEDCPCVENYENVFNFDHSLQTSKKRKNVESRHRRSNFAMENTKLSVENSKIPKKSFSNENDSLLISKSANGVINYAQKNSVKNENILMKSTKTDEAVQNSNVIIVKKSLLKPRA